MAHPNHLVIVCGHAIWLGGPKNGWDESEWLIEDWKKGETPTFIAHIKAGLKVLSQDARAILAFSGGPTRRDTRLSEARSYENLAAANAYFGHIPVPAGGFELSPRIILEERALDSYYNILFSLVLFWRTFRTWPERLTIVSHAFKRARLVDENCAAIGFPLERVNFIGINPPGVDEAGVSLTGGGAALSGDVAATKAAIMKDIALVKRQWKEDPHGTGEILAGKRKRRNAWGIDQRLFATEEERARSAVSTMMLEDGTEALAENASRPWAVTVKSVSFR